MSELRGLGAVNDELTKRGGRVLTVSVDPPAESRKVVSRHKLPFPILADEDHAVIRSYGLVHAGGGTKGEEVAIPALLLVDRDGRIVWRHVSRLVQDRADPADVLAAIRALK